MKIATIDPNAPLGYPDLVGLEKYLQQEPESLAFLLLPQAIAPHLQSYEALVEWGAELACTWQRLPSLQDSLDPKAQFSLPSNSN